MKKLFSFFLVLLLFSCASSSPIYIATSEKEAIRTLYKNENLKIFSSEHDYLLKELYRRLVAKDIDIYPSGLGYTVFEEDGKDTFYLMVYLRPKEIVFDKATKPEERLSSVLKDYLPKYIQVLKEEDLTDTSGVAFGIFWPVRDFSQCKKFGGFIEYLIVHLKKKEFLEVLKKEKELFEVLKGAEIVTSQELKEQKSIKLIF